MKISFLLISAAAVGVLASNVSERIATGLDPRAVVDTAGSVCPLVPTTTVALQPVFYSEFFPYNTVIDPFRNGAPLTVSNAPTPIVVQSTLTYTFGAALNSSTATSSTAAATISASNLAFGQGLPTGISSDLPNELFVFLAFDRLPTDQTRIKRDPLLRRQAVTPIMAVDLSNNRGDDLPGGVNQEQCDNATPLLLQNGMLVSFDQTVSKVLGADNAILGLALPNPGVLTQTFTSADGVLQWLTTDAGRASFFNCGGTLFAGFPSAPSSDCIAVQVGVIAGIVCQERVRRTRSVDPLFRAPMLLSSTSSTTTTGTSAISAGTTAVTRDATPTRSVSSTEPSTTTSSSIALSTTPSSSVALSTTTSTSRLLDASTSTASSSDAPTSTTTTTSAESSTTSQSTTTTPSPMTGLLTTTTKTTTTSVTTTTTTTAAATTTTTAGAAPLPPPPSCNNQGVSFAIFSHPFANTDPPTYSGISVQYFKTNNPTQQGTTNTIGFTAVGTASIYGGAPIDVTSKAVLQRGYLYTPLSGEYTFSITASDDISFLWLGAVAYAGYNRGNAAIEQAGGTAIETLTVTYTAGQYIPIRMLTVNDQFATAFNMRIERPDGVTILDGIFFAGSDYIVQFSCDGTSAPAFPAFGTEV